MPLFLAFCFGGAAAWSSSKTWGSFDRLVFLRGAAFLGCGGLGSIGGDGASCEGFVFGFFLLVFFVFVEESQEEGHEEDDLDDQNS